MTRHSILALCAALPLFLTGCSDGGDYPALMPTEQLLAEPTLPEAQASPVATKAEVEARSRALQARAQALSGPVIEPDIQRRMQQAQQAASE